MSTRDHLFSSDTREEMNPSFSVKTLGKDHEDIFQ